MKSILQQYENMEIGINFEKPFRIEAAKLIQVADDYFSILDLQKGYTHHFSYRSIVQIIEHDNGVEVGGFFTHKDNHKIVVKVGHIIEYIPT